MNKPRQTEQSKQFHMDRAEAKRLRRYATPRALAIFTVPVLTKSRQVERAEFRAEIKNGARIKATRDREAKQLALEVRKSQTSQFRLAAMRAVSVLSRAV